MEISLGGFGKAVAQPRRDSYLPQGTGQEIPNALGNVAQAGQKLASTFQEVEEQKQRVQAASELAQTSNDYYDAHDQIGRDVAEGKIKPQDAIPEFNARTAEIRKVRTQGLTPFQIESMEPSLIKTIGALTRNLEGVAIKRTQSDIGANILTTGEALQRTALRDLPGSITQYDQVVDTMGPQAGWSPEESAKKKQIFKEGATFNFANATLEGAAQTGDMSLVRAARERIQGPEGEVIDPAKRTALITKAYAYENGIVASGIRDQEKQQREQEARENKGRDAFKDAQNLMLNGRYLSTEYIGQLADITAGTSAAPAVQELVKSQADAAGFASLPLSKQTAIIEQRQAAGSTPGVGTSPDQQKLTDYMERIRDGGKKAYAENPWTAAQERGVIPRAPAVSLNNIQDAQNVLAERMKQINTVEAATERKISPLQPQEADQISRMVRMMPPDQQSSALATIGTAVGDSDRLAALAKQMHDKDATLGLAMMLAGDKTTQGRYASELLIRGDRALKDKSIQVDAARETGWKGTIAAEVGDAFPNQEVRQKVIESAYMINAGIVAEGGSSDPSRAIRLAVGPIVEHNGSKLPLPRGMEESDFNKRIKAVQAVTIAEQTTDNNVYSGRTAIPIDQFIKQLPDAVLVHAGPGRYNVKAGGGLITNSQGQRISVKVQP